MDLSEFDFSKMDMRIDLMSDSDDPYFKNQLFQKYSEFNAIVPLHRRKVLKYIIGVYDKKSPLRTSDIMKTKILAAELAGFKRTSNRFERLVDAMMMCEIEQINAMIVRYVSIQKDVTYQKYCILQEAYARAGKEILDGATKDINQFTKIEDELTATQDELVQNDNSEKIKQELYRFYLEDRVELRPEEIAAKLKENPNELPC
jgi:hypothetical protein